MEPSEIIQLQDAIVAEAASNINSPWDAAVVNIEINLVDGGRTEDCLALLFRRKFGWWSRLLRRRDGKWIRGSFQFSMKCLDLFGELQENSLSDKPWTACTLEFDRDGKYRFSFNYDPPLRLNGNFGKEAMLEGYVPQI